MVGLGGGSLPKFCHRHLVRTEIEVIEIDPDVIALRDAFMVPPDGDRFRVIQADAAEYLRAAEDHADVIFLDGFGVGAFPMRCVRRLSTPIASAPCARTASS